MKHVFVINPIAGKENPARLLGPKIHEAFLGMEADLEIYMTKGRQDAIRFVRERCACSFGEELRFYACGGDGTISEVLSGMYDCTNASLGVIPCGTGNDFVKCYPNADFLSIEAQLKGEEKRIDAIRFNDLVSLNICNVGLDADVAHNMHRFKHWPMVSGVGAYNLAIAYTFFSRLGKAAVITLDDTTVLEANSMLMVIANGQYYGGNYRGAPLAQLDDGLMDVCLVPKLPRATMLRIIGKYQKGLHISDPEVKQLVTYTRCKSLTVQYREPVTMCVDGETFINDSITARVLPGQVRFLVPAAKAMSAVCKEEQVKQPVMV